MTRLTTCCPNCGHNPPHEERYPWLYGLTRQQREIMLILLERPGQWVTTERLLLLMYATSPNGEPDSAYKNVAVQVHRIRKQIGNVIESQWGDGYRVRVDDEGNIVDSDQTNNRKSADGKNS